jgi:hypothetical protein
MPPQEREPVPPRPEAPILTAFGYGHCLDMPLTQADGSPVVGHDGSAVTGGSFLDTYHDPKRRQHTQDMLDGFLGMGPDDPDYAAAQAYIGSYLRAYFGEPNLGAD